MKKRPLLLLVLLSLLLVFSAFTQGESRDFEDLAGVIHPDLFQTLQDFNNSLEHSNGIKLKVIVRDFLGGKNIRTYAEQSLESSGQSGLILLVMVIGEENYDAVVDMAAETIISKEKLDNVLDLSFREPYKRERAYDKALASFALKLSETLMPSGISRQTGDRLREFAGMEALALPTVTPAPAGNDSWLDSIFQDRKHSEDTSKQYDEDARYAENNKSGGFSLIQIAVIGFVLYKIFGKKRQGKKGCGPLSWIFGTWGISKFFGWRK